MIGLPPSVTQPVTGGADCNQCTADASTRVMQANQRVPVPGRGLRAASIASRAR